jgi:ribose transport system ATP-binding protein
MGKEESSLLKMEGISKFFPGVKALEGVCLQLFSGEVHSLMGENGAGKSTLMKILGGVHQPNEGCMVLNGEPYEPRMPLDAQRRGVGFIHQELKLATNMTVAENISLGRMPTKGFGVVDYRAVNRVAREALEELGVQIDPLAKVESLNVAMQQMVEIAKAISLKSRILIMDEPTASLSERETQYLFKIIKRLRDTGVSIVYISHRMEEVYALSDRITVLRDGQTIGTWQLCDLTQDQLVCHMVGRELKDQFPQRNSKAGKEELKVTGLTRAGAFQDVSFTLHGGEIAGMGGLVGAGRTEIARAVLGLDAYDSGTVKVCSPESDRHAIGYITEDRKGDGLVLGLSIEDNITLPNLDQVSNGFLLDQTKSRKMARKWVEKLRVRTPSVKQSVGNLSGGNQQKVVIAKWIARNCRILIFDEPTRGVDIGARAEIYAIIEELAQNGVAILIISSDLPELLGLSDRIMVVHQGRIAGEFTRVEATPEKVIRCAFTGEKE